MASIIILAIIAIIYLCRDQFFSQKTPRFLFYILLLLTVVASYFSFKSGIEESNTQNYIKGGIDTVYVLNWKIDSLTIKLSEATKLIEKKDERIDELELKTKEIERKSNSIKSFLINFSFKATTLKSHKVDNFSLTGEPRKIKLISDNKNEYTFETERTFYLKRIEPNVIESSNKYFIENNSSLIGEDLKTLKNVRFLEFFPNLYLNEAALKKIYLDFSFIINGKTLVNKVNLEINLSDTKKMRVDIKEIINNSLLFIN